jgi:hypothetical protein
MKKLLLYVFLIGMLSSCKLLGIGNKSGSSTAKQDSGCPSTGRNVGAEKLLSDNNKEKKAPKYTKDKTLIYQ